MSTVDQLRAQIAALDEEIVERIAERVDLAGRIGVLKRDAGGSVLDPEREAAVIRHAVGAARDRGLPVEPVREIFWMLMQLCRSAQVEER